MLCGISSVLCSNFAEVHFTIHLSRIDKMTTGVNVISLPPSPHFLAKCKGLKINVMSWQNCYHSGKKILTFHPSFGHLSTPGKCLATFCTSRSIKQVPLEQRGLSSKSASLLPNFEIIFRLYFFSSNITDFNNIKLASLKYYRFVFFNIIFLKIFIMEANSLLSQALCFNVQELQLFSIVACFSKQSFHINVKVHFIKLYYV